MTERLVLEWRDIPLQMLLVVVVVSYKLWVTAAEK